MTDEDGPVVSTYGESFAEDEYGNIGDQVTEVFPFERVETTTTYTPNSDAWFISNPEFVTISATSALGSSQTQTWDPEYDDLGRLKSVTRSPNGPNTEYHKTEYMLDGFGNPYQIIESVSSGEPPRTTNITYDADNVYPFVVQDALGNATQIHYDERWGLPATISDPNGIVQQQSYDGLGLLSETDDSTGKTVYTYSLESGAFGIASGFIHPRVKVKADRQGAQGTRTGSEIQETDYLGRMVRTQSEGLDGATVIREQVFDDHGRLIATTLPHQTGSSHVGTRTYDYDDMDRPTLVHNSDGTTAQRQYASIATLKSDYQHWFYRECFTSEFRFCPDADVAVSIDESRLRNVLVRDYRGGVIRNFDGNNVDGAALYSSYFYDGLRQLETIGENGAPSNGIASIVTSFLHDAYGRVVKHYDPDTAPNPTQYTYNGFDEVAVETDPGLQQRSYTHDLLGRVTDITDSQGPTTFTYDHDANSATFRPNAIGRLTSMSSPPTGANPAGQHVDFFYEPVASPDRGLLQRADYVIDGNTYSVEYSYDDLGRASTISYPDLGNGPRVVAKYQYDNSGVLTNLSELQGNVTNPLWQINVPGFEGYLVQDETFGNNSHSTYGYDPDRHFLRSIATTQPTSSQGTATVQDVTYERNPNGQIWYRGPALDRGGPNGIGFEYQYDALGRLSSFQDLSSSSTALSYNYDDFGNITQNGVHAVAYNYPSARPHEVLGIDNNIYGYDARGNVSHREGPDVPGGVQDITYTQFNLPSSITTGGNTTQFEYTANEERLVRRDSDGVRYFVGDLYQRLATPDGVSTTEERFRLYAGSRLVGEVVRTPGNADRTQFFHTDDLDTVDTISGTSSADAVHQSFEPFGAPLGSTSELTRVGFTGQEHDADLGLIDMRGRIYDPLAGRFMSQDPVMQAPFCSQGPNRYSYVFNDPVNAADPSGFDICIELGGATDCYTTNTTLPGMSGGGVASDAAEVGGDVGGNTAASAASNAVSPGAASMIAGGVGTIFRLLAGNPFAAQPGYSASGTGNFHGAAGAGKAQSGGQGLSPAERQLVDEAANLPDLSQPTPVPKTFDPQTEQAIRSLHPKLQQRARDFIGALQRLGYSARIVEGARSMAAQANDFAYGRTKMSPVQRPGCGPLGCPVTNARPGSSPHNFGKAFDINPDPATEAAGARIAPLYGLEPGANFKTFVDPPSFRSARLEKFPMNRAVLAALALPILLCSVSGAEPQSHSKIASIRGHLFSNATGQVDLAVDAFSQGPFWNKRDSSTLLVLTELRDLPNANSNGVLTVVARFGGTQALRQQFHLSTYFSETQMLTLPLLVHGPFCTPVVIDTDLAIDGKHADHRTAKADFQCGE